MKFSKYRNISMLLIIGVAMAGTACKVGVGTICSFGVGWFTFTCPLGFLQLVLASKSLMTEMWFSVGLTILLIIVLGRIFCAWICPTALLQNIFRRQPGSRRRKVLRKPATVSLKSVAVSDSNGVAQPVKIETAWEQYAPYAVLGGALVSSFVLGFPVFCVVCPIGLFFGALFAASRLFLTQQPGIELILFPAMLIVELVILKRWCFVFCPLGALLRIISRLNFFVRPVSEPTSCIHTTGGSCQACVNVCAEGIDLRQMETPAARSNCTKCLDCYGVCPSESVKIKLFSREK